MTEQESRDNINMVLWTRFAEDKLLKSCDSLADIQSHLQPIKEDLLAMAKYYQDDDPRTGMETYGFQSVEAIKDNLYYISDRWSSEFRIRWLLDLIDLDETTEKDN